MRGAWFGKNALVLLGIHGMLAGIGLAGLFPYFHTLFYAMFLLLSFLLGLMGYFERDCLKWPGLLAMVISGGLFVHWLIMLIIRLKGM